MNKINFGGKKYPDQQLVVLNKTQYLVLYIMILFLFNEKKISPFKKNVTPIV